jgi:protocatechuate 3,4-dioxygenase beta subunit
LTLLSASLSVTGQVLDTQGYPIGKAMIYGWGEGQPIKLNTQADAEGRFTLAGVCAGPIDLRVDADWGGGKHLQAHVLADGGATGLQITPLYSVGR